MHYITLHGDADQVGNFFFAVRHTFGRGLHSRPGLDVGACGEVYRLKYSVHGTPDGGAGPAPTPGFIAFLFRLFLLLLGMATEGGGGDVGRATHPGYQIISFALPSGHGPRWSGRWSLEGPGKWSRKWNPGTRPRLPGERAPRGPSPA